MWAYLVFYFLKYLEVQIQSELQKFKQIFSTKNFNECTGYNLRNLEMSSWTIFFW